MFNLKVFVMTSDRWLNRQLVISRTLCSFVWQMITDVFRFILVCAQCYLLSRLILRIFFLVRPPNDSHVPHIFLLCYFLCVSFCVSEVPEQPCPATSRSDVGA